jgi:RNA polymerase-binding transcription factor DksA
MMEEQKSHACKQFVRRRQYSAQIQKIDSYGLHAGSPIYFYCQDCGTPIEVLPEMQSFNPYAHCSQCKGLRENDWMNDAKKMAEIDE